jgi:lysophospholipase L1-like esterase
MSAKLRARGRLACVLGILAAALVAVPSAPADSVKPPKLTAPKHVYLALGDSLAFGFQQAKLNGALAGGTYSPSLFTTGYVDDFFAAFAPQAPADAAIENLGCPGETSDTLMSATNATTGCTTFPFPIHRNHPGTTQLEAALDVLDEEHGRVSPVTLNIGANDVLRMVGTCTSTTTGAVDLTCVQGKAPATYAHIQANVSAILDELRDESPSTEIIVVGIYNPLYPKIYQQVALQTGSPAAAGAAAAGTDALAAQLNALLADAAAAHRAFFADPLPAFNPPGNPAVELGTICSLTAVCGPLRDIHPTDAGYQVLGNVVMAASGY